MTLLEELDDYGEGHAVPHEAARRIRQLEAILKEIKSFNGLRNDRDAYLYHLIGWGQGFKEERPIPEEYGQDEFLD